MKKNILGVALAGAMLLTCTAFAGPQMTFGPNNEGNLQLDYKGQFQMVVRDTGSGPTKGDTTTDFNFRRNRLALMGSYGDIFGLYVQTEFLEKQNVNPLTVVDGDNASDFSMLDAQMRFEFNEAFNVYVGKFKYNFSRENLEACEAPLTLDRSLFIRAPYVATRDKGVAVWGKVFSNKLQYRLDAMNGRSAAGDVTPKSNFRFSGRAHISLLDPESTYGYKGTYLGKKKVLTIGGAFQRESDIAYSDSVNKSGAVDYKGWTADLFFEYPVADVGTFTFSSAYEKIDLGGAYKGNNPDFDTIGLNGEKNGWYVKGAYMLPNTPLQIFARYEKWKFAALNLSSTGLAADTIYDQRVDWFGVGANYYFRDQNLKLSMEYAKTNFDKNNDSTKDFGTFITQLQVIF